MRELRHTDRHIWVRAAAAAVCFVMLFAQTGCISLLKLGAESEAEDVVIDFVDSFLENPDKCKFSKYCAEDVEFDLTDDQREVFDELTSGVRGKVKNTKINDSWNKATVYVQVTHVYDISEFEVTSGTIDEILNEANRVGEDTYDLKFVLKLNDDGDWVITLMDEFKELMMDPYLTLNINDGSEPDPNNGILVVPNIGNDVVSDTDLVLNSYIYNVWYDVEMEFPLTVNQVDEDKAYAIMSVFYFNTPISGTFSGVLLTADDKVVMSSDFHVSGEVTVECDFSAGMSGWVSFDPGSYHVELYYDGNLVATSESITIK